MKNKKRTVIILLIIAILIAVVPLFTLKGAEFGGSDDAGSQVVSEITGKSINLGLHQLWKNGLAENYLVK